MKRRSAPAEVATDGAQRGMKQFCRRERQLIPLTRGPRLPWTAAIQPLTRAPCAAQLLVQVIGNACAQRARSGLIRGDQPIARGFDEQRLLGIEEQVGRLAGLYG